MNPCGQHAKATNALLPWSRTPIPQCEKDGRLCLDFCASKSEPNCNRDATCSVVHVHGTLDLITVTSLWAYSEVLIQKPASKQRVQMLVALIISRCQQVWHKATLGCLDRAVHQGFQHGGHIAAVLVRTAPGCMSVPYNCTEVLCRYFNLNLIALSTKPTPGLSLGMVYQTSSC